MSRYEMNKVSHDDSSSTTSTAEKIGAFRALSLQTYFFSPRAETLKTQSRLFTSSYRSSQFNKRIKGEKVNGSLLKPRFHVFHSTHHSHVVLLKTAKIVDSYACNSRTFYSLSTAGNGKNAPCHLRF